MIDYLRPKRQPVLMLYDGILEAAQKRKGVDPDVWILLERENVWRMARDYAQQKGLRVPLMSDIESAERSACGHVDYAAKWAYGVARLLQGDSNAVKQRP